ncbi:MAG: Crp/Fnr family transcriptional regulator [Oxalobacteraceae bacterium]|nr:MAG: Crp/Fnr family transcriptional regulator [Oxalobacteraceae bacterium]
MSDAKVSPLISMIDTFARHAPISSEDRTALLELPFALRLVDAGSYLVREGNTPDHCAMLVSGLACRHKISGQGFRQIVSVHVPGDVIDLQQLYLETADHNVQTLNQCMVVRVPREALRQLAADRLGIAQAIVATVLVELAIAREWILNIGRRDARTRIAHFLCELAVRLDMPGLPPGQPFELPMTQEQLGDALGLTAVHINRMFMGLVRDGLITRCKHSITIPSWERLVQAAGFNSRYLKLNG